MFKLKSKFELGKILKLMLIAIIYAVWCYYFFAQPVNAYTVYYNANSYPGYTYQCSYYDRQGYCYYVKNDYGYYDKGPSSTTYPYNYYYGQNVGIAFGVGGICPN